MNRRFFLKAIPAAIGTAVAAYYLPEIAAQTAVEIGRPSDSNRVKSLRAEAQRLRDEFFALHHDEMLFRAMSGEFA